jgi:hypothetical protein
MAEYPKSAKRVGSKPTPRSNGTGKRVNHNSGVKKALKSARQAEAKARQSEYDNLLPAQKIENLDKVLGKNQGATKERAKLAAKVAEEQASQAAKTPKKSSKV